MPPVKPARQYAVPVQNLRDRLEVFHKDESESQLAQLDLGEFPISSPATSNNLPELDSDEKFHFLRWLHRSNGSDIAIIDHVKHGRRILKIHKDSDLFQSEKAAYSHLRHFDVRSCVLICYGWATVTPKSFAKEKKPTCIGPEDGYMQERRDHSRDASLPTPLRSDRASASYDWDNPADLKLWDLDIDFRPPSVKESWNWVLDTSQFGKDGQWMPDGEDLTYGRKALLLEYLPNPRRFQSHILTEQIALNALDAWQQIQKALIRPGDHAERISRNVLVAENGRVIFIDFDRSRVFQSVDTHRLIRFKKETLQFYRIVFKWMLAPKMEGKTSRFD